MTRPRSMPYSAPPFALLHPLDDSQVLTLPVPGYRQARNYCCGFAATLMVLRHFERPVRGPQLFSALGTARDGTGQGAMVRVLRSAGLRANPRYDMNFDRMAAWLSAAKVLIGYLKDEEHWLVIYGFGRSPRRVFVADPELESEKCCEQLWESYGERLGGFSLVCSPARSAAQSKESFSPQMCFDFGGPP